MQNNFYAVIMAGGGGTRLWPLSRTNKPKQCLKLGTDRTLFQVAVDRLINSFDYDHIIIVTGKNQAEDLQGQIPEIPVQNYLLEPMPKDTAGAVGYAAAVLAERDPESVMAILTADHFIGEVSYFNQLLRDASKLAKMDYLVTLGIEPTFPSTGYGYIQMGKKLEVLGETPVYEVLRFTEKPDSETAKRMIAGKDHAWNSGMFIWKTQSILNEYAKQLPENYSLLKEIGAAWGTADQQEVLSSKWPALKKVSVDYGIMEHAQNVVVLPAAGLGWNDAGSWDSLYDILKKDEFGNIKEHRNLVDHKSSNTLVLSDNSDRLIALIGLDNVVVVDTGDVLLVCKRDQTQNVKSVVDKLKVEGKNQYL